LQATARVERLHVDSAVPLTAGLQADKQWRIDADLRTGEQMVRAWRQRGSVPSESQSGLRRIDPPEPLVLGQQPAKDGSRTSVEAAPRSADSIVSLVICELLAIAALLILLVIEAQHSPHFVKFAAIAMAGAGAVLLLTFVRWQSERNRDQVKDRPSVTDVVPATSILPSRHASKSSYRDLARRTRPAGWR
jgi:hypothetical protein